MSPANLASQLINCVYAISGITLLRIKCNNFCYFTTFAIFPLLLFWLILLFLLLLHSASFFANQSTPASKRPTRSNCPFWHDECDTAWHISALPNFSLPNFSLANFALPNFALPNFALPNFALPNFALPNLPLPNFALPNFALLNFCLPNLAQPNLAQPNFALPNFALPILRILPSSC